MKLRHSPAVLLLALCACGSREEGVQLHLQLDLRPTRDATAEGTTRSFTTAQGGHVTLTRALVTLGSLELFPCTTTTSRMWRWLRQLSPIGTAQAHTVSTNPRLLGTPHVSGLERSDGEALALGTLEPPPADYCRARLVFAPADEDAAGLPTDVDMQGKTLILEGQLVPAEGGAAQPFHLESNGLTNAEVWLEKLSLSEKAPEASRTVHLAYDHWLDGVDPASLDAAEQVLRNVAASASID